MPGQVRVGRQATNWGEGLFMRGISQVSPIDVAALRRPGTELKEALLPTWSVVANLGLPEGRSLEAFYQLKWEPTVLEYCGSFFGMSSLTAAPDPGQCNSFDFQGGPNPMLGQTSATAASIPLVKGDKPSDAGAWGLQFRFPVDAIDTEFALYAMNISSTLPSMLITCCAPILWSISITSASQLKSSTTLKVRKCLSHISVSWPTLIKSFLRSHRKKGKNHYFQQNYLNSPEKLKS